VYNRKSNYTQITLNKFVKHDHDGVNIEDSHHATVIGNTFLSDTSGEGPDGLEFDSSDSCLAADNSFTGYEGDGIDVRSSTNCNITTSTFIGNQDGVAVQGSNDTLISHCSFTYNDRGIKDSNGNNTIATECTFDYNDNGILLNGYILNAIGNSFSWNEYALVGTGYAASFIANNSIFDNKWGITLESTHDDTVVEWNCFTNNLFIRDQGTNNVFRFNYYADYSGADADSDYIGDSAHPIPGTAGNQDATPLMYCPRAPVFAPPLVDQELIYGARLNYTVTATAPAPLNPASWQINDTTNFAISGNSTACEVTDTAVLGVGTYYISISVANIYGVTLTGIIKVTVTPVAFDLLPMLLLGIAIVVIIVLILVVAYIFYRRRSK
jgi:parallel beta-helix repeat protein